MSSVCGFEQWAAQPFHVRSPHQHERVISSPTGGRPTARVLSAIWDNTRCRTRFYRSVKETGYYVLSEGSMYKDNVRFYDVVDDSPTVPMPDKLAEYLEYLVAQQQAVKEKPKGKVAGFSDHKSEVDLDSPFYEGSIHPRLVSIAGHYVRNKNINDVEELYTLLIGKLEKNGVYASDRVTLFQYDAEKVRKIAESAVASWKTGEQIKQESQIALTQPQAGAAQTQVPPTFKHPAVAGSFRDFVVNPKMGQKDGWFPLGSVSLIGGSSGSNKSTWALDLLYEQSKGGEIWGHGSARRPYLVFSLDRGKFSHHRTMDRMGYELDEIPVRFLPPAVKDGVAVKAILDHIESEPVMPQVVFVEGADMLVADANKGQFVVPFMGALQKIAEHYHIAFILSVGAPKMRIGEGYTAKRDSMLGSEKWSRMSETVVSMQFVEGDDVDSRRVCFVLLRNGAAERFNLNLHNGKLVLDDAPQPQPSNQRARARDEIEATKAWYTRLFAAVKTSPNGEKTVSLKEHRLAMRGYAFSRTAVEHAHKFLGIYYDRAKKAYILMGAPTNDPKAGNTVNMDAPPKPAEGKPEDTAKPAAGQREAEKMFQQNKSCREVADTLGVSKSTAGRWKKEWLT